VPPKQAARAAASGYHKSIFINCPFDDGYRRLFQATVFAVFDCGYIPRCALEVYDSGQVRIDKICNLIEACRFGIHDISRTELEAQSQLPRFNMPLELGIFLGAQRFGSGVHKKKNCLILDRERYRYQQFISDISGQDIAAHHGDCTALITRLRDWIQTAESTAGALPSGGAIAARFETFQDELPAICAKLNLIPSELTFADYGEVVRVWLTSPQLLPLPIVHTKS
jgi:hypothetical protein